ncbi:MAG: rod shape-determining protein MreD [Aristaeellaceae bacterium]
MRKKLSALWDAVKGQVKFFLVVLLGYLFQVCVMPYFSIGGVTPSLLFVHIAILTVGYGRLRALWVGGIYGILMEIMLPTLSMLNLLLYPLSALFCSIFFADKSDKQLEEERSIGQMLVRKHDLSARLSAMLDVVRGEPGHNASPYIRTPLCAGMNVLIYEIVNLVFIYLGGTALEQAHYARSLLDILLTVLLTVVLMLPVRRFLGFRKQVQEKRPQPRY